MSILRYILLVSAAVKLIWFALPVYTGRILNVGNGTGMILCILFLRAVYFPETVLNLPFSLKVCLLLFLLLFAAELVFCFLQMVKSMFRRPSGTETVIVLGCGVDGEEPSRILQSRIDRAASYLKAHPSLTCVVTGGKGDEKNISEAEAMIRGLKAQGIAEDRIIREDKAVSTYENFCFSAPYINGKAAVITSEFHMYRSLMIAKHYGIDGYAVPAKTPWWLLLTFGFREMLCIPYEILRLKRKTAC